jgi:hypothetical protein
MSLKKILSKAKRTDEEKVSMTIKIPTTLKKDFDELCKKNKVSITSMLLTFIEDVVDEDKNDNSDESINNLQDILINMNQLIENGIDESDIGFDPSLIKKATEAKLRKM